MINLTFPITVSVAKTSNPHSDFLDRLFGLKSPSNNTFTQFNFKVIIWKRFRGLFPNMNRTLVLSTSA